MTGEITTYVKFTIYFQNEVFGDERPDEDEEVVVATQKDFFSTGSTCYPAGILSCCRKYCGCNHSEQEGFLVCLDI